MYRIKSVAEKEETLHHNEIKPAAQGSNVNATGSLSTKKDKKLTLFGYADEMMHAKIAKTPDKY